MRSPLRRSLSHQILSTQILCAFLNFPKCATYLTHLIPLHSFLLINSADKYNFEASRSVVCPIPLLLPPPPPQ